MRRGGECRTLGPAAATHRGVRSPRATLGSFRCEGCERGRGLESTKRWPAAWPPCGSVRRVNCSCASVRSVRVHVGAGGVRMAPDLVARPRCCSAHLHAWATLPLVRLSSSGYPSPKPEWLTEGTMLRAQKLAASAFSCFLRASAEMKSDL